MERRIKRILCTYSISNGKKGSGQEKGYGECAYQVSEELTENLQEWVRNSRLTLNTLVQGAWAYLMSRYSGDNDVVFGVTSAGRPTDLIGREYGGAIY